MKVFVTTCDAHLWTLRVFSYLFNKFWSASQPVYVLGESLPPFKLPPNFIYRSAGVPWGKSRYSDAVIEFIQREINESHFAWLLDDYWLVRTVDHSGIKTMHEFMVENKKILRVDLTSDRMFAGGAKDVGYYGHYDLVEAVGSQYQMSLQAGIWDTKLLLKVLQRGWSPWDVELSGTTVVNESDMRVIGTKQQLVRYANGLKSDSNEVNIKGIPREHTKTILEANWIPRKFEGKIKQ